MPNSSTRSVNELSGIRISRPPRRVPRLVWWVSILCIATVATGAAWAASRAPSMGRNGMVVSTHHAAAAAGGQILEEGGNAVDAAVATAFALGVVQPFSAGLGGGFFALVRRSDGRVHALDARETAPAAATETMFSEPGVPRFASVRGPLAVAVPSFVPGMVELLERHGTMTLEQVLAPAIVLAEGGVEIGRYHARMVGFMRGRLPAEVFPETNRIQFAPFDSKEIWGQRLVQEDLGKTLRRLATEGGRIFRGGEIGRAMVAEVKRRGGVLALDDLENYQPKWRDPVIGEYRGYRVASFPPPSSGGAVLIEALNVLSGFDLGALRAGGGTAIHLVAEAMKLAFADRAAYMGDSDFVEVPIAGLISQEYAVAQRKRIDPNKATAIRGPGKLPSDSGTTHLSVTDSAGRAVALTMTINTPFGSGITVPGTGVILNNEMDDFAVARNKPNSYGLIDTRGANLVAPGKRPLSSMTPTILDRRGRLFMVTGSPGGPRIISTTLLTVLNVVDWKMDPQAAVSAPRYHHQWDPNWLRMEPEFSDEVIESLEDRGHEVERSTRHWSAAEVIVIDPVSGFHLGGTDPRTDGAAVGVDVIHDVVVPGR